MSNNTETISPRWAGFHRLWIIVAIILFLLLLLLWLLGHGPNGKKCVVPPTIVEKIVEKQVEVDSPKLLSRIGSLEKENSGIKGLQEKIVELKNKAPIIKTVETIVEKQVEVDNPKLLSRIGVLEKENAEIKGLQAKIVELQNKAPIIKTVEKLVTAPDTQAPRLGVKGSSIITILVGESFTDDGVIALDNIDNKVDVKVTGMVDANTAGEYILTYTATDAAGNTSTETRKVIVEAPASTDGAENTAAVKREVTVDAPLVLAKLYFELNSSEFPADTELSLSSVISHLRTHSSSKAFISGFHDPSGNAEHNKQLAYDRSIAVRDLLQQSGITPDRIELKKAEETTGTGSAEEARRVEVSVSK